jgi:hypothetical protein
MTNRDIENAVTRFVLAHEKPLIERLGTFAGREPPADVAFGDPDGGRGPADCLGLAVSVHVAVVGVRAGRSDGPRCGRRWRDWWRSRGRGLGEFVIG